MCLQIFAKGIYAVNYETGGMIVGMKSFHTSPKGELLSAYGTCPYKFDKNGFAIPNDQEQSVKLVLMTPDGLTTTARWISLGYHVHYIHQGFILGAVGTAALVEFPPSAVQLVGEDIVVSTFRLVNPEHIDYLLDQLVDLEVDIDGIRRRQEALWKYASWEPSKEA